LWEISARKSPSPLPFGTAAVSASFAYDQAGRQTAKSYAVADTATMLRSYAYDNRNRLLGRGGRGLRSSSVLPTTEDRDQMSVEREFRFGRVRLSPQYRLVLEEATQRIQSITGDSFRAVTLVFGRMLACVLDQLIIVQVATNRRPPRVSVVVIDLSIGNAPRALLPAQVPDDFEECCRILALENEEECTEFRRFVMQEQPRLRR
jgi:hypothetical protein